RTPGTASEATVRQLLTSLRKSALPLVKDGKLSVGELEGRVGEVTALTAPAGTDAVRTRAELLLLEARLTAAEPPTEPELLAGLDQLRQVASMLSSGALGSKDFEHLLALLQGHPVPVTHRGAPV